MIDLFTINFDSLTNEARYSAIAEFAEAQPVESYRHDFKTLWANDTLKDVAALANTFGGILVLGIEKGQNDHVARLIGVSSDSELTTRIASAIATNISPTPSYDIMECHAPGEPTKRFCVIRVRSDATLYLVTKKDISSPVWIRNADQTLRADAAELRRMIDRERQTTPNMGDLMLDRSHRILEDMIVGHSYIAEIESWPMGSWQRSETYFKLALIPTDTKIVPLDRRDETKFANLIHEHYRRVQSCVRGATPAAADAESRSSDYYEYRWYHRNLDYEGRWRITNRLEVAHSTQVKVRGEEFWSLFDIVAYAILLLKVGGKWWETLKYFGDGILVAELRVQALQVVRGTSGQFLKLFGPVTGDLGMRAEVAQMHPQQRGEAQAYVPIDFASMRDNVPGVVTGLMNPLLRNLGHSVLQAEFRDNVDVITRNVGQ